jgi:hypothetical protein
MLYRLTEIAEHQEAALHLMEAALLAGWVEAVEEDLPLKLPAADERMRKALVQLAEVLAKEGKKMYGYDYAWILQLTDDDKGKTMPTFKGVSAFRNYLLQLGIDNVCGVSTLNEYYNKVSGTFPEWRFTDEPAPCDGYERLRRIQIARRFLELYRQCLTNAA